MFIAASEDIGNADPQALSPEGLVFGRDSEFFGRQRNVR